VKLGIGRESGAISSYLALGKWPASARLSNAPTVINLAGSAGPMSRHGLATHMQSRPDQRAGYGQFRPFWGDVIPETSGPVRPSSSSPSPRPSPETHQGKIEAFLARCTVPRRGRGGDLLTFCSGVWVRALFAYGTRSAVRRMTTPVGIASRGVPFFKGGKNYPRGNSVRRGNPQLLEGAPGNFFCSSHQAPRCPTPRAADLEEIIHLVDELVQPLAQPPSLVP
jgi:hypothetical protein